ncbi:zinc knuckle CX2CX4HX4C containing protein [Tanacetum coccineum]
MIVDDHSNYTWVVFVDSKDDVLEKFKILCKKIENLHDCSIISVETNHCSGFDKLQFGSFCEQHKMSYNLSGPFTSQSNEIVDRTHRKLRKMNRAIFSEPKLSPLIEDDKINEPIVQDLNGSPSLEVNILDEGYPKSVKEARGHPIEQVIGELNERTLSKVGSGSVNLDGKGTTRRVTLDGSPMISNSSPLISPSTTINMPRGLYIGKHDELLSEMTNDDRMETMDAIDDSINIIVDEFTKPSDHIIQFVDINTKSTSYAGAAGASVKDQPKVSTHLEHTLYGYFIGKRMAFPVVEYYARNNWAKHGLKRIMMNSKGFFFFKFDSRAGLKAVLEGGPWLIRKSQIILKKWSLDTRLLKEELTRIPIWVKLHDVPIQVFEEDGISLISTFIGKPVMLDSYTRSMCNEFPPTVTTFNVVTPTIEKTNDGFLQTSKKEALHASSTIDGERMVLLDNLLGYPDNVLDNQIFDTASDDSHPSNVEIYLNDEEDDGDNMIIPQTPSEEIRTRIDDEVYFSFGRHLDELHVTWAHLEKKRTRLRTNTKTLEDLCS